MDKRFFLALFLSLIAIAISQLLFPPVKRTSSNPAADSLLGGKSTSSSTQPMTVRPSPAEARATTVSQTRVAVATTPTGPAPLAAETTTVNTPRAIYKFSNVGAAPVSIVIRDYKNRSARGGLVDLGAPGAPLLSYRLVTSTDTADLAQVPFKLKTPLILPPLQTRRGASPHPGGRFASSTPRVLPTECHRPLWTPQCGS